MAFSVQMPALGESVTEGTVTRWLKQEGDTVEVDEPLLEVSTDKVDTEIPSPAAGVLTKIVAQEDDTVEIGGELAQIGDADEAPSSDAPAEDAAPAEESAPEEAAEEPTPAAEPEPQAEEEAPAASASSDSSGSGTPVTMPELGESVTEGTVTRWLKAVGDEVAVDEPLLEVSTDKVDTEIPSPVAGTLLEISAEEDDTVAVGGQLAVIGSGSPAEKAPEPEATPEPEAPKAEEPKKEEPKKEAPKQEAPKAEPKPEPKQEAPKAAPAKESAPSGDSSPYVTPLVRKLASDNDVDLSTVKGTGVGGRIRKQDVLAAAEAKKAPA
ncbi:MAG: 2-oxoglutarate dehydrogenase, E2 component, dihydrolipoamide succinyltransferase, partial [Rhodococcus sp. (in: high G+C Gram-positive bacteria)]